MHRVRQMPAPLRHAGRPQRYWPHNRHVSPRLPEALPNTPVRPVPISARREIPLSGEFPAFIFGTLHFSAKQTRRTTILPAFCSKGNNSMQNSDFRLKNTIFVKSEKTATLWPIENFCSEMKPSHWAPSMPVCRASTPIPAPPPPKSRNTSRTTRSLPSETSTANGRPTRRPPWKRPSACRSAANGRWSA